MTLDTAFQMQLGSVLLLAIVSVMLILLQVDRLEAYKRRIALASIATFLGGATAIFYLEEIKAFLWDNPPHKRQVARPSQNAGWEGNGPGRRLAGAGIAREDHDHSAAGEDADERRTLAVKVTHNRFQECAECPEMVIIPGTQTGQVHRAGARHDGIASFAIGRFELTVAEFQAFVVKTSYKPATRCEAIGTATAPTVGAPYLRDGARGMAGRPVSCVSWRDAQAYVAWLAQRTARAYRLPTAVEWWHAARGGASAMMAPAAAVVVQRVALVAPTAPEIGTTPSNGYGVFDMAGGVTEWAYQCQSERGAVDPPSARGCNRLALGGSWADGASITATQAVDPRLARTTIGVRVVRDLAHPQGH